MAGVLITVDPLWGVTDARRFLGGSLAVGKTIVKAAYNNSAPTDANATQGMNALDAALLANIGTIEVPTDVLAWSMGSQIVKKWARQKGPDHITNGTLDPAKIRFYMLGCPERKFTGASVVYPAQTPAVYPGGAYGTGYGLPASCPWNMWDIAQQYDGWADAPANAANSEMARMVSLGWFQYTQMFSHSPFCVMKRTPGPHDSYAVPLSDPSVQTYTDPAQPTVRYPWIKTYPIASLQAIKSIRWLASTLDQQRRPVAETAFSNRPITLTPPNYASTAVTWF